MILKVLLAGGNLDTVTAVQHLLGLAIAVALYLVLLRRGAPRWLAALAAAPILLDAYQLQIEQTIMPDVWFEALIVAGLALLLWQAVPGPWLIAAGGLALGASAPVAQVGQILVVPALVYLLVVVAAGGARCSARSCCAWRSPFPSPGSRCVSPWSLISSRSPPPRGAPSTGGWPRARTARR